MLGSKGAGLPPPPLGTGLGPRPCPLPPPGWPAVPCHPCPCPEPGGVPSHSQARMSPSRLLLRPSLSISCPTGLETILGDCAVASSRNPSPVQPARLGVSCSGPGRFRSDFMGLTTPGPREARRGREQGGGLSRFLLRLPPLQLPSLAQMKGQGRGPWLPAPAPGPRQSPKGVLIRLLSQAGGILELQVAFRPVQAFGRHPQPRGWQDSATVSR